MAQNLNQVPPDLEVWEVNGHHILVKVLPGNPPIYLYWDVASSDRREALGIKKVDRKFTSWSQLLKTGAISMGDSTELANLTVDPYDQILDNYAQVVKVKPWMADPDFLALWVGASYEGRELADFEIQNTEYWRTHSESERQWMTLNFGDPATAQQLINDNRARVADLFIQSGADGISQQLINTIADAWTTGSWSEVYAMNQIRMVADPNLQGTRDPLLKGLTGGVQGTHLQEDTVQEMINAYLGPALGANYSQDFISKWASRMRESPDAKVELENLLKTQFQTFLNAPDKNGNRPYGNSTNLTYEDVAGPWRGLWQQTLGEVANETDPLFLQLIKTNDLATNARVLRQDGLKKKNATVGRSLLSDLGSAFGGQVRPSDSAVM